MSKKAQTRQIMRSLSKPQEVAKVLKKELLYQDSVVEEDVVAVEAEAAEEIILPVAEVEEVNVAKEMI